MGNKIVKSENYKGHTIEIYLTASLDYGFKVIKNGQVLYQNEPYTYMTYTVQSAKLYLDQKEK